MCEKFKELCSASYNPNYDAQSVHIYIDGKVRRAGYYYEGGGAEYDDDISLDFIYCPYCGTRL